MTNNIQQAVNDKRSTSVKILGWDDAMTKMKMIYIKFFMFFQIVYEEKLCSRDG